MRRTLLLSILLVSVPTVGPVHADGPTDDSVISALDTTYRERIAPLFERYCYRCHGTEKQKAEVNLAIVGGTAEVHKSRKTWETLIENVEIGLMPPDGEMPTEEEISEIIAWVNSALEAGVGDCNIIQPGRVTMRRLNRAEYDNTVRDLLGFDANPSRNFPRDDVGYGFDNIGDVLMMPPLLLEKYFDAAEELADRAIVVPIPDPGRTMGVAGRLLQGGDPHGETARWLKSAGEMSIPLDLPRSGRYRIIVKAAADQAGDEPAKMVLLIDGKAAGEFDVEATPGAPGEYDVNVSIRRGSHKVSVAFLNDYYDPNSADPDRRDRNLIVDSIQAEGPQGPPAWPWKNLRARELDGGERGRGERTLASEGEITAKIDFPKAGRYRFEAHAYADQAGPESARMGLRIDGEDVVAFEVLAGSKSEPGTYRGSADVPAGEHQIALAFLNDYYKGDDAPEADRGDRNLHVVGLDLLAGTPIDLPESHRRIIVRDPKGSANWASAARESLQPFLDRAYRRPAAADEVDRLVSLVELARKDGEPFERGMQLAVTASLVNPNFLFRVEADRSSEVSASGVARDLSGFELASRLSYFLWSSMPDAELMRLAADGTLTNPEVLEAQTRRMLADSKSSSLVTNFADQWLTLRRLQDSSPDKRRFKEFDNELRASMLRETEMFFDSILREDRSVLDLIDADYTFVDKRLAELYGIEGVEGTSSAGSSFRPTALAAGF